MLLPYFVYIALQNSLVEALCLWQIFEHGEVKSGRKSFAKKKKEKKNKPKEERKVTILSRKEKYPFVKATGALSWRPDFEQRSHCQTKIFHT